MARIIPLPPSSAGACSAGALYTVQPLVGALLGVGWLGEPLTAFTLAGGGLILVGLHLAVKSGRVG